MTTSTPGVEVVHLNPGGCGGSMTKHIILCSSVFLIFAFMAPGFADEHFPFLAQVIKESVNVRAGPNTNFEKIDKLNRGSRVVVLGRSYEWYKIQPLPTTKAYIRSDYLNIIKGGDIALVLGDNVNIRCSAGSDAASLGEVKKGTLVKVLGQAQGWCRLTPVAGTVAWIHQDFLKEISADVPVSLLIQEIKMPLAPIPENSLKAVPSAGVSPWVSMRGTMEALVNPQADVHYEIVLDDKSIFYLQDIPQISFFCNTLVDVEGAIVPDPQKKFMYPLLHINKIALVL
jgi:SH3-like domain-containing protein